MAVRRDPLIAERTVRFYRWDALGDPPKSAVDILAALRTIGGLPFTSSGRYLELNNGDANCAWVDDLAAVPKVRLGTLRRGDWPQIERAGALLDVPAAPNDSVAESIHVCFFDNQIVGGEFNFYGPRLASRLGVYLTERGGAPPLALTPLVRQDAAARLDQLRDVRLFHLRIQPSFLESQPGLDNDIVEMFRAARRAGQPRDLEIVLRVTPYARDETLGGRVLQFAKDLAGRAGIRDNAKVFMAQGFNPVEGRLEDVDLLQDKLFISAEIRRAGPRTRVLDTPDTYRAILQAYEENLDQLAASASQMAAGDG